MGLFVGWVVRDGAKFMGARRRFEIVANFWGAGFIGGVHHALGEMVLLGSEI